MGVETELKLALSAEMAARVPALAPLNAVPAQRDELRNIYFDTPDLRLHQARVALRLRQQAGKIEQTLKTRSASVGGLSRRGEWNWTRDQLCLDPALLDAECWPAELADVDLAAMEPMFRTDFQRQSWIVAPAAGVRIEVALDLGEIRSRGRCEPIQELELELLEGPESALMDLLAELKSAGLEASPLDLSKAERGFRLRGV